jgi:hypothetical protein
MNGKNDYATITLICNHPILQIGMLLSSHIVSEGGHG